MSNLQDELLNSYESPVSTKTDELKSSEASEDAEHKTETTTQSDASVDAEHKPEMSDLPDELLNSYESPVSTKTDEPKTSDASEDAEHKPETTTQPNASEDAEHKPETTTQSDASVDAKHKPELSDLRDELLNSYESPKTDEPKTSDASEDAEHKPETTTQTDASVDAEHKPEMSDLQNELLHSYESPVSTKTDEPKTSDASEDADHKPETTTLTKDQIHSSIGLDSEITKVSIRSSSPIENTVTGSRTEAEDKSYLSIMLDSEVTKSPIGKVINVLHRPLENSYRPHEDVQLRYIRGDTTLTLGNAMISSVQRSNLGEKLEFSIGDHDKKDSALVHLLLLEKYENILISFQEKRKRRHKCTTTLQNFEHEKCQKSVMECIGVENNNIEFESDDDLGFRDDSSEPISYLKEMDFTLSKNETSQESGNFTSVKSFGEHSRTEDEQKPTIKHDDHQVPPIAREEEIWLCSTPDTSTEFVHYYSTPAQCTSDGDSMNSSRCSSLISVIENRESVYSCYYSPVIEMKKQSKQTSISKPRFKYVSSDNDYESLTNLRVNRKEEMLIQYAIQLQIIREARKALIVAKNTPQLFDWKIFAEAEKILHVARYRRDIIADLLTQTITDDGDKNGATATIRISNIKFFSSDIHKNPKKHKRNEKYFLCILHCESTILGSELVALEGNEILFENNFQFEHLPSEFEITLNLFSMKEMPKKVKKKINFFGKKNGASANVQNQSLFVSWGKTIVKPTDVPQESPAALSLRNIPAEANISSSYTADILLL